MTIQDQILAEDVFFIPGGYVFVKAVDETEVCFVVRLSGRSIVGNDEQVLPIDEFTKLYVVKSI